MISERPIWIDGDGVRLDARLREGTGSLSALVLHPHPQYGGDMDNHVVVAVADALSGAGATTLRVNFRGVGGSTGQYADGLGESTDAEAALSFLRGQRPSSPLVLAGYSFGAMIAASVAARSGPDAIVLISPPLAYGALQAIEPDLPVLAVGGDRDSVCPAEALRGLEAPNVRVVVVPGTDHSWWPGLEALAAEVVKFAQQRVAILSDT